MKTVILCGGSGTRLRELTEEIPKPLVDIGGKPILWHVMKMYAHYGFKDFILCLGYMGDKIKDRLSSIDEWNIEFVDTGEETNTGGRIKRIEKLIDGPFFVNYSDGLANIDLNKLLEFHKSHGKIATVTAVRPHSQFGIMQIEGDNVKGFIEKPMLKEWVNGGFFVFSLKVFDYIKGDDILEKEPLESLAKQSQLCAFKHTGFWKCMDTYKDNMVLNKMWSENKASWRVW